MWTSYQAASGVLPLVILGIIVVESLQQKIRSELAKFSVRYGRLLLAIC